MAVPLVVSGYYCNCLTFVLFRSVKALLDWLRSYAFYTIIWLLSDLDLPAVQHVLPNFIYPNPAKSFRPGWHVVGRSRWRNGVRV